MQRTWGRPYLLLMPKVRCSRPHATEPPDVRRLGTLPPLRGGELRLIGSRRCAPDVAQRQMGRTGVSSREPRSRPSWREACSQSVGAVGAPPNQRLQRTRGRSYVRCRLKLRSRRSHATEPQRSAASDASSTTQYGLSSSEAAGSAHPGGTATGDTYGCVEPERREPGSRRAPRGPSPLGA